MDNLDALLAAGKLSYNALLGGFASGAGAAGSLAVNQLFQPQGTSQQIGSTIGSMLGFANPALGPFGAAAGMAIGSAFGPDPSVGPNGNVNFGVDPNGMLSVGSIGGDNGMPTDFLGQFAGVGANRFNDLLGQYGGQLNALPENTPFGFSVGGNDSDPTIRLGDWLGPLLNSDSFSKALLQHGYVSGLSDDDMQSFLAALGGPDPREISLFGKWATPENIPTIAQKYLVNINGIEALGGGIDPLQYQQMRGGIDIGGSVNSGFAGATGSGGD